MTENGRRILRSYLVRHGDGYKAAACVIGCTEKTFTKKLNNYEGAGFDWQEMCDLVNHYEVTWPDLCDLCNGWLNKE